MSEMQGLPVNPIKLVKAFTEEAPRYPELVKLWERHLAFWDLTGGYDATTAEEIEQTHDLVVDRAEQVLADSRLVTDDEILRNHSELALRAAREYRRLKLKPSLLAVEETSL